MNNLLLNCRPLAVFNPDNKEHRRAYHSFLKRSTWSHSPFQFVLEPGFEDVPTMCRIRLSAYYVDKEFNKPIKKPIKKSTINKNHNKLSVVKIPHKND